jgi:hypothetical protein
MHSIISKNIMQKAFPEKASSHAHGNGKAPTKL